MKQAAERRRKENKRRIFEIRTTVAQLILNEDKVGDKDKCHPY